MIQIQALKSVLAKAGKYVSSRSSLPVLACFLLECDGETLTIRGTDLAKDIKAVIEVKGIDPFACLVNAAKLDEFIRVVSAAEINMVLTGNHLFVSHGSGGINFPVQDANEFPPERRYSEGCDKFIIEKQTLVSLLERVSYAAATDEARPVLQGVQLSINHNVEVAATDGFRIAFDTTPRTEETKAVKLIVPASDFRLMTSHLVGPTVEVVYDDQHHVLNILDGRSQYGLTLIDGNYPDFSQIVPKFGDMLTKVKVTYYELAKALKQANVISREGTGVVRIRMSPQERPEDGVIEIEASSEESGSAAFIANATIEGAEIKFAINANFLMQAIEKADENEIEILVNQPNTPVVVKEPGSDWYCVIMPMNME